jgi:hypothetical protein
MRRPTFKKFSSLMLSAAALGLLAAGSAHALGVTPVVPIDVSPTVTVSMTTTMTVPATPPATAVPAPIPLSASAAIVSLPSPTLVPTPGPGAPGAPGQPSGTFTVLTRSGQAPLPVLRVKWPAAEPGDFIIKGYRLFRSEPDTGVFTQRPPSDSKGDSLLNALMADDPVQIGSIYNYVVEAVDFKGQAGPRSSVLREDLQDLPAAQVAPRAPEGVTASAGRETIKLKWQVAPAWVAPVSSYRVYRGLNLDSLQSVTEITGIAYEDTPPARAKDYIYRVATVDNAGRVSVQGLTVSARATGALAPGAPVALTAKAQVEKVNLTWSAAPPGTSPVTAYLLRRRLADSEVWKNFALMSASTTARADNVAGDQGYVYSLAAIDAEGLTGDAVYVAASPTTKVWNKTLVVLMPTAYANNKASDKGINLNVLFDFYVGSLYESYTNSITGFTKNGLFQPLQIGTVTSDLKWALLDDRGLVPGLAFGSYTAALIPFGNPDQGQSVGASSAGGSISTLGSVYGVVSKRFWPGEPRAAVHVGLMYGKLSDYLTSDPTPVGWRPTIRHLTPGGDIPMLFNRFVDPKQDALVAQSSHMVYGGIQFPFNVPLIIDTWHTGLRLEVMMPLADEAAWPAGTLVPDGSNPQSYLPVMTNIHIDNLPLFGFEFSLFEYQGGYQVIAFYHIPDLSWAW